MAYVELSSNGETARIDLPEILDLSAAESLKAALSAALSDGKPFTLDAERVERLSTPCLQVLLSAERAMKEADIPFSLANPSDAFIDTFNDLGVFSHLKQWTIEG